MKLNSISEKSIESDCDGVFLVDKPEHFTSYKVVSCIKKRLKARKAGHAGSLDPISTGLLVILLGKATKLFDTIVAGDKVYEGTLVLGVRTDTQDVEGKIIEEKDIKDIKQSDIKEAFEKFVGDIYQIPSSFSALKHNGTPLYKLARKGIFIQKDPRKISIKSFDVVSIKLPQVKFRVFCSRGTYVRQLCEDIGQHLKTGAYLLQLRRISCGCYDVKNALTFSEIEKMSIEELRKKIMPV